MKWTNRSAADWVMWDHSRNPAAPKLPKDAPADLIEFIKANRAEVLEATRDRYLSAPPIGMPIVAAKYSQGLLPRLRMWVGAQLSMSPPVRQWFQARLGAGFDFDCDKSTAAILELVAWQMSHKPDPAGFLANLD